MVFVVCVRGGEEVVGSFVLVEISKKSLKIEIKRIPKRVPTR